MKYKVLYIFGCIVCVALVVWGVYAGVHYLLRHFGQADGAQAMQGSEIAYEAQPAGSTGHVPSKKLVVPTDDDKEYHPNKPTVKLKSDHFEIEFPDKPWFADGHGWGAPIVEGERGNVDLAESLPDVIGDPENPSDDTIQVGPPRPPKHDLDFEVGHRARQSDDQAPAPGPSPVPEPVSLVLLGTGLIGLAAWRRKR